MQAQPELQKLEPVLFAQHARKLKSLGVSPGQINLLAVKLPVLFEQQSFLKSTKTGMDILNYFCKVRDTGKECMNHVARCTTGSVSRIWGVVRAAV